MPTNVTWNGTVYSVPLEGEENWPSLSNFLIALGNNAAVANTVKQSIRVATTTPVTVSATTDYTVVTDLASAGAVAVNLPAGAARQVFIIVDGKGDAGTNNITITPNGAQTIGGAANLVLSYNRQAVMVQYEEGTTDWKILYNVIYPTVIQSLLDGKQPLDATLTALAAYNTNGLVTQTATDTFTGRTITAGSSKISVTNGNGVSGNPTVDVAEAQLTLDNIGGTLGIAKGGTGQTAQTAAFDALAPTTTKGDIIAHNGSNNIRVAVGTDGQVLAANSANPSGLGWAAALSNPMTTEGDIIIGGASGSPTRLAIGTNLYILRSNGTTLSWVEGLANGTQSGLLPPTTAMGDVLATQLGYKRYQHGTIYNGGNAPTVTLAAGGGTLSSVNLTSFIPYQTQEGSWRLRFNVTVTLSSTARTTVRLNVAGVTFAGSFQSLSGNNNQVSAVGGAYTRSGGGDMEMFYSSVSATEHYFSGDVDLASKPTWAY